jgi:PAS domain S-box-containing protein
VYYGTVVEGWEANCRSLLDSASEGIALHDGVHFGYANTAMLRLLGYSEGESLSGVPVSEWMDRHAPPDDTGVREWATTGVVARPLRVIRRGGSESTLEGHSECLSAGSATRALYLRDPAGAAAAASAARSARSLRTVIDNAPFGMTLNRLGRVLYANKKVLEFNGLGDEQAMVGRAPREIVESLGSAEDSARINSAFGGLFASLGEDWRSGPAPAVHVHDVHLRRPDGGVRTYDVHGVIVDYEGEPALVSYIVDLTERRAIEERVRFADRMVSLGTLAAGIAHEISNPLAYVLTSVELVASRLRWGEPETLQSHLRDAMEGLDRIRRIAHNLKTFARPDEAARGPVDVNAVLTSCLEMAKGHLASRARVERDFDGPLVAWGNEGQLAQVFLNLLINAAQALDESPASRNRVAVRAASAGDAVVVEIADNGPGIPPEHLTRIFDPFFTTKPVGVGTGLGLSISYGIVKALGGDITVDSTVGEGTSIRVRLPGGRHGRAASLTLG